MEIGAALAADLRALTEALAEPGTDLESLLLALSRDMRLSVSTFIGLTLTLVVDGQPVSFTAFDGAADGAIDGKVDGAVDGKVDGATDGTVHGPSGGRTVATSVALPLPAISGAEPGSELVLYAGAPGAFTDLVADVSHAVGVVLGDFVIDAHRRLPLADSRLLELSAINQAIGWLIDRGHTVDEAQRELWRQATAAGSTVHLAAQALLQSGRDGSSSALADGPLA